MEKGVVIIDIPYGATGIEIRFLFPDPEISAITATEEWLMFKRFVSRLSGETMPTKILDSPEFDKLEEALPGRIKTLLLRALRNSWRGSKTGKLSELRKMAKEGGISALSDLRNVGPQQAALLYELLVK